MTRWLFIILVALFWNWVAWYGSAHGEEGPYHVRRNPYADVPISWYIFRDTEVPMGPFWDAESALDTAEALNEAHRRRINEKDHTCVSADSGGLKFVPCKEMP